MKYAVRVLGFFVLCLTMVLEAFFQVLYNLLSILWNLDFKHLIAIAPNFHFEPKAVSPNYYATPIDYLFHKVTKFNIKAYQKECKVG